MKSPRKRRICGLGLLAHLGWCVLCTASLAQDANPGALDVANVEGTLVAATQDRIKLKTEDGQEHIAVLNQQSTLKYSGTADISFLRPGLYVRFSGMFDTQQGKLLAPLEEFEIFKPVASRRMTREQMQAQTPGIYPVVPNDQAGKEGRRGGQAAAQRGDATGGQQEFRVVGRVGAIDTGRMQVIAGNRPLIVELAAEPKISVSAGDTTFCQPGDKVSASGLSNAQQENWLAAESVEIEAAEPLALPTQQAGQRPPRQPRDKPGARKPGDGDGKLGDGK